MDSSQNGDLVGESDPSDDAQNSSRQAAADYYEHDQDCAGEHQYPVLSMRVPAEGFLAIGGKDQVEPVDHQISFEQHEDDGAAVDDQALNRRIYRRSPNSFSNNVQFNSSNLECFHRMQKEYFNLFAKHREQFSDVEDADNNDGDDNGWNSMDEKEEAFCNSCLDGADNINDSREVAVPMDTPPESVGHFSVSLGNLMLFCSGFQFDSDGNNQPHPLDNVGLYNADTGSWMNAVARNGENVECCGGLAVLDRSRSRLFLVGGHRSGSASNTSLIFELKDWSWHSLDVPEEHNFSPRDKMSGWMHEERLFMFGGYGEDIHDFVCNEGGGYFLPNDEGVSLGWNNQLMTLDETSGRWLEVATSGTPPSPRAAHSAVIVSGAVWLFGGRSGQDRLNDLHRLDMTTLQWSGRLLVEGAFPEGRSWHSFSVLDAENVFLYGGFSNNEEPLSDAWLFHPGRMQWTQLDFPLDRPRLWHSCISCDNGDLVVFGGCSTNIRCFDELQVSSNEVLVFRINPQPLRRRCLDVVAKDAAKLRAGLCHLPIALQSELRARLQAGRQASATLGGSTFA